MKFIVIAIILFFVKCTSGIDVFDETQYKLLRTDSLNGKVGSKIYVFKHDTLRKMIFEYDASGKLMGKMFTYKCKMDGNQTIYDLDGKTILVIDSFSHGQKVSSKSFRKKENQ